MFSHVSRLQYHARPDSPDPVFARKMQEVLGGQFGEISVMMQYLFQGWNCRGPQKYRDMLLDIGTEEIGHVEMLATMIARLLERASPDDQLAASADPAVGAVLGGTNVQDAVIAAAMNPQHLIVSGNGAMAADAMGYPWNAKYIIASGNLLADFRHNLTAESQGRLQVCRLYEMTADRGVRDMLSFLIARDTMHQNQWIAAIAELETSGLERTPVPSRFPTERQLNEVAYDFMNFSLDQSSAEGRWANGPAPDGIGQFRYVSEPVAMGEAPLLAPVDPRGYGTPDPAVPASM
jgi:Mn-containing catalase